MSSQELTAEAMALPLSERVSLAQALWESIDAALPDTAEDAALREAVRRDQEISSNSSLGRAHEEVMLAARRSIRAGMLGKEDIVAFSEDLQKQVAYAFEETEA